MPKYIKILEITAWKYNHTKIELKEGLILLKKIKKITIISCTINLSCYNFNGLPKYFSGDKYKYEDGLKYLEKLKNICNEIDIEKTIKEIKNKQSDFDELNEYLRQFNIELIFEHNEDLDFYVRLPN